MTPMGGDTLSKMKDEARKMLDCIEKSRKKEDCDEGKH